MVRELGEPEFIIDGFLLEGAQTMLYAPTGHGKSFASVDIACHVATGRAFHGLTVTQGAVIYVAAEAPLEIEKRVLAWERYHDKKTDNLRIIHVPVQLGNPDHMEALIQKAIKAMNASLMIFDTAERVTYGTDENLPTEVNQKVNAPIQDMITRTGVTSMLVHHAGVTGSRPRGCTAWETPNDTIIRINTKFARKRNRQQPESISIVVEKQRSTEPLAITLGTQTMRFRNGRSTLVLVDSPKFPNPVTTINSEPLQRQPSKRERTIGLLSDGAKHIQAIADEVYGGNTQVAKNEVGKLKREGQAINDGQGIWSLVQ